MASKPPYLKSITLFKCGSKAKLFNNPNKLPKNCQQQYATLRKFKTPSY